MTSFIGRRHELAETRSLLAHTRMLTLTGTGGVGKTRLAQQLAKELCRAFADGVWLVELGKLSDSSSLAQAVAESLQIRDALAGDPRTVVANYLSGRQLLLVLDNCEHVLPECAVFGLPCSNRRRSCGSWRPAGRR